MLLAKKKFEFHARVQKCHFGNFSFSPKCSEGRMRENCLVGRRNSWPVFFLIYGPFYVVEFGAALQKGTFSLVRLEKVHTLNDPFLFLTFPVGFEIPIIFSNWI